MNAEPSNGQKKDIEVPEKELLSWTTHPIRKRPLVSILVVTLIMAAGMAAYYTMDSKAFGVLAMVVLFASLAKFFMPTRFILTDKTVTIKSTTQKITKPWSMFRSFYPDRNGVLLSPFPEPSRLENFRGMYLIFADNRDQVVATLSTILKAEEKETESE